MKIAVFHNIASGGAKRALYGFVKQLQKTGHSIDAFIPDTADESYLPLRKVVNEYRIFPVRTTLSGLVASTFRYLPPLRISLVDLERAHKEIAEIINSGNYDVVMAEQDRFTSSPFVLKFLKKPALYCCPQPYRGSEAVVRNSDRGFLKNFWHRHFLLRVIPGIDRQNATSAGTILAYSYYGKDTILQAYGIDAMVCYPGVDLDMFRPLSVAKEDFVLSVGSITPAKGYDFLVDSMAEIRQAIRPKLLIVANFGDPRYQKTLEERARVRGVTLEIRTLVGDLELVGYYNRAKLFAYAPYGEPLGLSPLEAAACGTPTVAVGEGGVKETVHHNRTGLLTHRNETAFSEALTQLLYDDNKRKRMGENALEMVRASWSLGSAGVKLVTCLQQAVGNRVEPTN